MLTIVKKNDSYDAITYQLENEDNSTVDLTGASVNFVMGKKNKLITNAKATVTSATSGIVSYQLTPSDTLVSGTFLAEFVVTFANGTTKTYPSNGYITVDVEQNLDTSQNNVVLDMIATKQGDFEAKLDSILKQGTGTQVSAMNEYTWTATSGQTIFVFPTSAKYDPSAKWFQVSVGNVPITNELINRASSSQFSLVVDPSLIVAGMTVHAMWVEPIVPITGGHHSTHEINGQDEINIANLRNYQELVATPIASNTTALADKVSQSVVADVITLKPSGDTTGTTDTTNIQNAVNAVVKGGTIYLGSGTFYIGNILLTKEVYFKGTTSAGINSGNNYGTVIKPSSSATYMFLFQGSSSTILSGGGFQYIRFDGNSQALSYIVRGLWISHFFIEQCGFNNVNGTAISVQRVQESGIFKCYFRKCGNPTSPVVYFDAIASAYTGDNCNNFHVEFNTFGFNSGNWIGASSTANLDIIWIKGNKMEWDGTPTWANSSATAVINLGEVSRCWIHDNAFNFFTSAHNNYSTVISLGNNNGAVSIRDNKLYGCSGTWLSITNPRVLASSNEAIMVNSGDDLTLSNASPLACEIEEVVKKDSNGNIRIRKTNPFKDFISSHHLGSPALRTFVQDSGSLTHMGTVKSSSTQYDEFGRINIGSYVSHFNPTLNFRVRVKTPTANGAVLVYLDATALTSTSVPTANGWMWVTFSVTVANITATSVLKIINNGTATLYLDGYVLN